MEQQGLGPMVKSWVGGGANLPISADQVHQAFGADTIRALAAKTGMDPQKLGAEAFKNLAPGNRQTDSGRCGAGQLIEHNTAGNQHRIVALRMYSPQKTTNNHKEYVL